MSKEFEAHIDDNDIEGIAEKASAAEIIEALDRVIFKLEREDTEGTDVNEVGRAKTNITHQNHRGIMRANAANAYLNKRYGNLRGNEGVFRVGLLDTIIKEKTTWINSIDGKGKQEIIDALNALKVEIRSEGSLDIGDRLLGVGRR